MRRLLRLNRNALAASVLSVSMVAGVVVTALGQEGYQESRIELHEAGVWVTQTGQVGRLNTQIESMELSLTAGAMVRPDVAQDGDVVVAFDRSGTMVGVEPALHDITAEVGLPPGAEVQLGGGTGVVADLVGGQVWLAPGADLASLDPKKEPPTWPSSGEGAATAPAAQDETDAGEAADPGEAVAPTGSPVIAAATGTDGVVHVVEAGGERVVSLALPGQGDAERAVSLSGAVATPQVTAVGAVPVVLDDESGLLHLPGRAPVDLSTHGDALRLQLPGPNSREVLVGVAGAVLGVDLASGTVRERIAGGAAGPVNPVWALGCAYGAWSSEGNVPKVGRWCGDRRLKTLAIPFEDPEVAPGAGIRFRVNRERVVLNDPVSGVSLTVDHEVPKVVKDWPEPLNEEGETDAVDPIDVPTDEVACSADPARATASDAEAGTRAGVPVIVPILDRVTADPCDVVAVSVGSDPIEGAEVGVVREGSAIQVTPERGRTDPVVVKYTATSAGGSGSATLTVAVKTGNGQIQAKADRTVVEAGEVVRHNVLGNDVDPEGDPLTLVGVAGVAEGQGRVQYQANGMITYTAPGVASDPVSVTYTVVDDHGGRTDGILEITVLAPGTPQAPRVTADRVSTVVGAEVSVNLLANDTDANGDPLHLAKVHDVPPAFGSSWTPDGVLTLTPTGPGSRRLAYSVSDGSTEVQGSVLVEVAEEGTNRKPLAVRDDVAARPGVPAVVDLVANDVDPDGHLLAVTSVDVPPDAGLSVELLAMHKVRVTADASFTSSVGSMVVPYRVSDGREWSTGRLVVRPLLVSEQNQEPIALDDVTTVRAGSAVAVTVLRNDVDPEGELLTIRSVAEVDPSQGRVFVQGDELRFLAASTGVGDVTTSYVVEDPDGNTSEAEVTVHILDPSSADQAPTAPPAEARVYAGRTVSIPLPLLTMDADGDVVSIVAVEPSATPRGRAEIVGGGLEYTAGPLDQGVDTFTYTVQDPAGRKDTGRVRVAVVRPPDTNSTPVAVPDRIWATAGMRRVIPVLENDVDADGDDLTILDGSVTEVSSGRGTVEVDPDNAGYLVYTGPDDVDDADPGASFGYEVDDGRGGTARGVVTISLLPDPPANKAPLARDDFAPARLPNTTVTVKVLTNDVDPDNPDPGDPDRRLVVTTADPRASVKPDGSLVVSVGTEPVTLLYQVEDGGGPDGDDRRTSWAIVTVPVVAEFPPVAEPDEIEVVAGADVTRNLLKNDRNPTGAKLELRITGVGSAPGLVAERVDDQAGTVKVTASDQARSTQFTYTIENAQGDPATGVVTVRVKRTEAADDTLVEALRLASTTVAMKVGDQRTVDLARLATPAGRYRYAITRQPTGGVTARAGGAAESVVTIVAPAGSGGTDTTIGVSVQDGTATPVEAEITVRVAPESGVGSVDRPSPADDEAVTNQGQKVVVPVLTNDRGEDLAVISAKVAAGGAGTAGHDDSSVTFTPDPRFTGTATLTYVVQSGADPTATAPANIRIRVIGRPGAPGVPDVDLDGSTATLTWAAAAPNGARITGYRVESDRSGFRQETGGTSLRFDFGPASALGGAFRFRVAALTDGDNTDLVWSGWSDPVSAKKAPSAPWSVRAVFDPARNGPTKAGGILHVEWAAPEYGAVPDRYVVTASPADVGPVTVTDTTAAVKGLQNGTAYQFTVVAESDEHGRSIASGPSAPAVPIGVPGPITALTATADSLTAALVIAWGTPSTDGGDRVKLTYQVSLDGALMEETAETAFSVAAGNWNRGASVKVVAVNSAGQSEPESISVAVKEIELRPVRGRIIISGGLGATTVFIDAGDAQPGTVLQVWSTMSTGWHDIDGTVYETQLTSPYDPVSFLIRRCLVEDPEVCSESVPAADDDGSLIVAAFPRVFPDAVQDGDTVTYSWEIDPAWVWSYEFRVYLAGGAATPDCSTGSMCHVSLDLADARYANGCIQVEASVMSHVGTVGSYCAPLTAVPQILTFSFLGPGGFAFTYSDLPNGTYEYSCQRPGQALGVNDFGDIQLSGSGSASICSDDSGLADIYYVRIEGPAEGWVGRWEFAP